MNISDLLSVTGRLRAEPCKVAVMGDLGLDVYYRGKFRPNNERSPNTEPFRVVQAEPASFGIDGMAAAVFKMAEALGAEATIIPFGEASIKMRVLAPPEIGKPEEVVFRVDTDAQACTHQTDRVLAARSLGSVLPGYGALLIADYGKGACNKGTLPAALSCAEAAGVPVLVDPSRDACKAYRGWDRYLGAQVIKCNAAEWEHVGDIRSQAWACDIFPWIVVTYGAGGMRLWDRDAWRWMDIRACHFERRSEGICDICGCGDMVLAVLGVCMAAGVKLEHACQLASAAAMLKMHKRGAAPVTLDEIENYLETLTCAAPATSSAP